MDKGALDGHYFKATNDPKRTFILGNYYVPDKAKHDKRVLSYIFKEEGRLCV
jgi:hypothetical protein